VTVDSRVLLDPADGSLGPLLRLADDRLTPGEGYGQHAHRDVDVVVVVLDGLLTHRWHRGAVLGAGDVGVLRAGDGLRHDEVAGDAGAHVVQTYLRRPDARLWVGAVAAGESVDPPSGLRVVAWGDEVTAAPASGPVTGPATVCVWQLDAVRPVWAE
jgi:redox-sensitive bicupin YhaK (pirin superfamily)